MTHNNQYNMTDTSINSKMIHLFKIHAILHYKQNYASDKPFLYNNCTTINKNKSTYFSSYTES